MRLLLHALSAFVVAGATSAQVAINNGQLIPHPTPQASEHFGSVVAIDGDDFAVSAPYASVGANLGAVHIYTRTPSGWQLQATLTPPEPMYPGQFGRSLSLDSANGRIAIGAQHPYSSGGAGTAYLFKRTGTTWNLEETFSVTFSDFFGYAVALEGDTLVIGDPSINTVRVYQRQPQGTWTSTTLDNSLFPFSGSGRGCALGLRGDRVAVGFLGANLYQSQPPYQMITIGEVELYARSGTTWQQTDFVISHDYSNNCGAVLAFNGDVLAARSGTTSTVIDIYRRLSDYQWLWEQRLQSPTPTSTFGASIAISGQQLLVSTPPGATLYQYRGATFLPPWVPIATFNEPTMSSVAGTAVALSGAHAIIGDANHLNAGVTSGDAFDFGVAAGPQTYCTGKLNSNSCIPNITWNGLPSVDPATFAYFWITAEQVVPQKYGTFFYGAAAGSSPFHGGTLCVASPVHRTALTNSAGFSSCSGLLSTNFTLRIQSGVDPALIAGANVFGQWWYRDPDTTPQGGLSNAIQFAIWP